MTLGKSLLYCIRLPIAAIVMLAQISAGYASRSSDLSGRVVFSDTGAPGATVSAARRVDSAPSASGQSVTTLTDEDGVFRLASLEDGTWTLHVEMVKQAQQHRSALIETVLSLIVPALKD